MQNTKKLSIIAILTLSAIVGILGAISLYTNNNFTQENATSPTSEFANTTSPTSEFANSTSIDSPWA